jgi:hypothetical protein
VASFSEWEGWPLCGQVAGVGVAVGVGDLEGVVGEEFVSRVRILGRAVESVLKENPSRGKTPIDSC